MGIARRADMGHLGGVVTRRGEVQSEAAGYRFHPLRVRFYPFAARGLAEEPAVGYQKRANDARDRGGGRRPVSARQRDRNEVRACITHRLGDDWEHAVLRGSFGGGHTW